MTGNFVLRNRCLLCGSGEKKILISRAFSDPSVREFLDTHYGGRIDLSEVADGRYEIAKCSRCGFIWQVYILNDEFMDKLYSRWILPDASFSKRGNADITLYAAYAREVGDISYQLNKRPGEIDLLDFGMGWGYWCLMAKAFGYKVTGVETSQDRVDFARKNGIETIGLSDMPPDKFDFINAHQVFEHLSDPLGTLKLLAAGLKRGGFINIAVPDGRKVEKELSHPGWKASKNAIQPMEHINCFKPETLLELGRLADLEAKQPFLVNQRHNLKYYLRGLLTDGYHRCFPNTRFYFMRRGVGL